MMSRIVAAVCLLFVAVSADNEWEKPSFCQENDCPVYKVIQEENVSKIHTVLYK